MAQNETRRGTRTVPPTPPSGGVIIKGSGQAVQAMMRTNDLRGGSGGVRTQMASSAVVRTAPKVYSPLYEMSNLMLPRDLRTMNSWIRHFYNSNPIVRNAINLHATYPISKFEITCKDPKIKNFFIDQADHIDLTGVLLSLSLEFWKHGEKIDSEALVTMGDGTQKAIKDIHIGDEVITHMGNIKKVISLFAKPTSTVIEEHLKIFRIKAMGLPTPLIISGKHPMFILPEEATRCVTPSCNQRKLRVWPVVEKCATCFKLKSKMKHQELPTFIETLGIKEGDIACSPFDTTVVENKKFTSDLCYALGFWLAEGSYCKAQRSYGHKYNGVRYTNFNKTLLENVQKIFQKLNPRIKDSGAIYESTADLTDSLKYDFWYEGELRNGPKWAEFFLKHCGEYSETKRISKVIMQLPSELQLELIAGFIDGDGSTDSNNGHIIMCTSSPNLANQFALILRRAGIRPTTSKMKLGQVRLTRGGMSKVSGKYLYRVKIAADDALKLLGPKIRGPKKDKLRQVKWSSLQTVLQENWQLLPIESIEDITNEYTKDLMYDLEVEDDHSYIANGIAVHNCFPYSELDENKGMWDYCFMHNPDYIRVKTNALTREPIITLVPDDALRRLAQTQNAADRTLRDQLPQEILYHLKRGEDIPLSNFNCAHLKMLSSDYDIRGTSIIVSVFKDLMLYDKIREAKLAQADNFINPITLVKLGDPTGVWKPNDQDIVNFRNAWMESTYDPDAKLITHGAVTVEKVSNAGQTLDMSSDLDLIIKNLYAGLMTPEAIMNGEGATYNSSSIGLEVLRARYERFRNLVTRWITKKIFEPISKIQDFYEYKDGEKKLIVPEVQWNKINLKDVDSYWNAVSGLMSDEPGKSKVSQRTAFSILDIDPDSEAQNLKEEAVRDFIKNKEIERLSKMTLEELKTLDLTKPIPDMHPDEAVGGEGSEGDLGGEGSSGLGGGFDLGDSGGEEGGETLVPASSVGGEE